MHAGSRHGAPEGMVRPVEDPDSVDPSKQSGRPYFLLGVLLAIIVVLAILVVIGTVVG